jgi:hypothetical protein
LVTASLLLSPYQVLLAQQDRVVDQIDIRRAIVLEGNVGAEAQPQYDRGPVNLQRKISGVTVNSVAAKINITQ